MRWQGKKNAFRWIITIIAILSAVLGASAWVLHKKSLGMEFESKGIDRTRSGFYDAVARGDVAAVQLFLADDYSPNTRYGRWEDPILTTAIEKNHLDIVRALISAGADVRATNVGYREQAIHVAAYCGNPQIVEMLLKAGADVNAEGNPHTEGGRFLPIYEVAIGRPCPLPDKPPRQPPIETEDRIRTAKILVEYGAHVDARHPGVYGGGPLHAAAFNGYSSIAQILSANGAEVDFEDAHGYTPLMSAATSGRTKTVETLLAMGAQPNHRTHHGTALLRTIQLIQEEADNRLKNRIEFLPEDRQLQQNRIEVVRLLLNAGADPKLTNAAGKNAYDFARHSEITRLLKTAQSRRDK